MVKKAVKSKRTDPAGLKIPNAWDQLPAKEVTLLEERAKRYMKFLDNCKTERETIEYILELARKEGFKPLPRLGAGKKLKPGSRVYFINKNRAMGLAIIGKKSHLEGFRLIAAHHDVPKLDIKQTPLYEKDGMALLKTHYYGGVKKFQWVTMPLALHGFAITKDGKKLNVRIGEKPTDPVFTITDIAIHLSRKLQDDRKSSAAIAGEELNLVIGHKPVPKRKKGDEDKPNRVKEAIIKHLHTELGMEEEDFAWGEFHAVPAHPSREVGFDRSMIGGYGHDDRGCVYASFEALCEIKVPEYTSAILMLDKEEIGSCGANGAQSMMVTDFLGMLVEAASGNATFADIRSTISETMVISADTSPPIDPTFSSTHDPLNSATLGKGVWVSKYSGSGGKMFSGEADVEFINYIRKMLSKEKIPYQFGELGKVDEGGGGTVAFLLSNLNMHVVDVCLPTLSLHSPFELISKVDYHYTVSAYKAFMEKAY
ncbi:MAG: aminopeptidase [Candidatus Rifleibacteriota bacterium]